jgi:hypothetical protein
MGPVVIERRCLTVRAEIKLISFDGSKFGRNLSHYVNPLEDIASGKP